MRKRQNALTFTAGQFAVNQKAASACNNILERVLISLRKLSFSYPTRSLAPQTNTLSLCVYILDLDPIERDALCLLAPLSLRSHLLYIPFPCGCWRVRALSHTFLSCPVGWSSCAGCVMAPPVFHSFCQRAYLLIVSLLLTAGQLFYPSQFVPRSSLG